MDRSGRRTNVFGQKRRINPPPAPRRNRPPARANFQAHHRSALLDERDRLSLRPGASLGPSPHRRRYSRKSRAAHRSSRHRRRPVPRRRPARRLHQNGRSRKARNRHRPRHRFHGPPLRADAAPARHRGRNHQAAGHLRPLRKSRGTHAAPGSLRRINRSRRRRNVRSPLPPLLRAAISHAENRRRKKSRRRSLVGPALYAGPLRARSRHMARSCANRNSREMDSLPRRNLAVKILGARPGIKRGPYVRMAASRLATNCKSRPTLLRVQILRRFFRRNRRPFPLSNNPRAQLPRQSTMLGTTNHIQSRPFSRNLPAPTQQFINPPQTSLPSRRTKLAFLKSPHSSRHRRQHQRPIMAKHRNIAPRPKTFHRRGPSRKLLSNRPHSQIIRQHHALKIQFLPQQIFHHAPR